GRGAAPFVGAWGQSHHKTKVQEKLAIGKAPMRSPIICVAYDKKSNEKIEDLRVDVNQLNYHL
ncbi:MAG: hypothetical protein ACI4IJ_00825, partial [Acutalibacteraceae bacterium]